MKKAIALTTSVILLGSLALVLVPATREEIHWRWESLNDDMASYESYIKSWPIGRHVAEAKVRYDEHKWAEAQTANTVQAYERYTELHAAQLLAARRHLTEAKERIEQLHWKAAAAANTLEGYQEYVTLHPGGKHAMDAKRSSETFLFQQALTQNSPYLLRAFINTYSDSTHVAAVLKRLMSLEDKAWEACRQNNTIEHYRDYLSQYPSGSHASDANSRIQFLDFRSAFNIPSRLTEDQMLQYSNKLSQETYSVVINQSLVYYETRRESEQDITTNEKRIVNPSPEQKACSLRLEANNFAVTAIYISHHSGLYCNRALFADKWGPTIIHNGSAGSGLEIGTFSSIHELFKFTNFLSKFSIVHGWFAVGDVLIPDLLWKSDEKARSFSSRDLPFYGHRFEISLQMQGIVFKIDGIKGLPATPINTYKQALALKTFLAIASQDGERQIPIK